MPPGQVPVPSMTELILSDPVMLIGLVLPLFIVGSLVWYRLRTYRRITSLAARNERRYDETREESAVHWQEAGARTERMIALLTEIRDQLARIAPPESPSKE